MNGTYLVVKVGDERYAIAVEEVREVRTGLDPTPLPGAPPAVLGLENVRGEVIPVVDLGGLIGAGARDDPAAIVVVEGGGRCAALAVGELLEVMPLSEESAQEDTEMLRSSTLIDGVLVGIVDTPAVLDAVENGGRG